MAFFAIPIPPDLQAQLSEGLRTFKQAWPAVNWVHPADYHLTLRFLGGLAPDAVARVLAEVKARAVLCEPFRLNLQGLSFFPPQRDRGVLWIGLASLPPEFMHLQKQLETWVQTLGFPPEHRPFTPHLTIGRFKSRDLEGLMEQLPRFAPRDWGELAAAEYALMKRRYGARDHTDQPLYEVLARVSVQVR